MDKKPNINLNKTVSQKQLKNDIIKNQRLYLSALHFMIWLFFFSDVKEYVNDLKNTDITLISIVATIFLALLLITIKPERERETSRLISLFFSIILLILWILFLFSEGGPFRPILEVETAPKITRSLWVKLNEETFLLISLLSMCWFSYELSNRINGLLIEFNREEEFQEKREVKRINANYNYNLINFFILFSISILFYSFIQSHITLLNLDIWLVLTILSTTIIFSFDFNKLNKNKNNQIKEKRVIEENHEVDNKNIDYIIPIPKFTYPIMQFFFLLMIFLIVGMPLYLGMPSLNFLVYTLAIKLISAGMLLGFIIYSLLSKQLQKISWIFSAIIVVCGIIIFDLLLEPHFEFSDSTYQTNAPYLPGVFWSGFLVALGFSLIDLAYHQYREEGRLIYFKDRTLGENFKKLKEENNIRDKKRINESNGNNKENNKEDNKEDNKENNKEDNKEDNKENNKENNKEKNKEKNKENNKLSKVADWFNEKFGKIRVSLWKARIHRSGRWILIGATISAFYFGYIKLQEKTFKTGYGSAFQVIRYISYALIALFIIWTFIQKALKRDFISIKNNNKKEKLNRKNKNNSNNNQKYNIPNRKRVITDVFDYIRVNANRIKTIIIISLIILPIITSASSGMIKLNKSKINSNNDETKYYDGEPINLGNLGTLTFTSISPLTKVSKSTLLGAPSLIERASDDIEKNVSATSKIPIIMAKNEFETAQIVISNFGVKDIEVLNVSISSTNSDKPAAFSLRPYIRSWKGTPWPWPRFVPQFVDEIQPGYPNYLYEFNGNQTHVQIVQNYQASAPKPIVEAGKSLSIWLTLYAGPDLAAGDYEDEITIQTTKGIFKAIIETHIWNFTIPIEHSLRTGIGNRRVYFLENRDTWNKNFLQHRMSPYFPHNARTFYTKNTTEFGTEIIFNYTMLEEDLGNAIANGLDSFRITYRPGALVEGCFTKEFNQSTIAFYRPLAEFLKNPTLPNGKTWLDLALVYAMDEPNEEQYPIFNQWSDLVHEADPGWKVLLTEQVEPEIENHVDIWCPYINTLNPENIAIQQAKGREFWYYTCCHLTHEPTVSFIDPAVDHRALFWAAFAFGFQGYLFWDAAAYVNVSDNDPYYMGYDAIGDAIMLLNDGNLNPINTIVWETMRDGLEDYEYFHMLLGKLGYSNELESIKTLWSNWHNYPRNTIDYLELRYRIGELIENSE